MNKPHSPPSLENLDAELVELERQLEEARARYQLELAKVMELCDRVMEDVKRQCGEDSELYLTMLFAGLKTEGGCH